MLADVTYEEWFAALEATTEELLWEACVSEPPVDAFLVAMRLGVTITEDVALPARAQMVRLGVEVAGGGNSAATIVLGEEHRFERRQFAVAHELGEFAAVRVFDRLGIDPRPSPFGSRERVANSLASRLLVPGRWYRTAGLACDWDLPTLKDQFWTASHELLARRMLDMSVPVVITLFDQGHLSWRRSNCGPVDSGLLETEYRCWQRCHHSGTAVHCERSHNTAVRCWPVHEPDWRREILRTDVECQDAD